MQSTFNVHLYLYTYFLNAHSSAFSYITVPVTPDWPHSFNPNFHISWSATYTVKYCKFKTCDCSCSFREWKRYWPLNSDKSWTLLWHLLSIFTPSLTIYSKHLSNSLARLSLELDFKGRCSITVSSYSYVFIYILLDTVCAHKGGLWGDIWQENCFPTRPTHPKNL